MVRSEQFRGRIILDRDSHVYAIVDVMMHGPHDGRPSKEKEIHRIRAPERPQAHTRSLRHAAAADLGCVLVGLLARGIEKRLHLGWLERPYRAMTTLENLLGHRLAAF